MSIMKKDVNIGLLLLIAATLIMFSGFTVYYQTTFKNVSQSYKEKLSELEQVTADLELKRSLLNETSLQLKLRKQQEEDLSTKFTGVREERDNLEADKNRLQTDLSQTKSELTSTKSELLAKITKLADTESKLISAYKEIQELEIDVENLKSDVTRLNKKVNCLKEKADADESSC